jgi:hypothetical protein
MSSTVVAMSGKGLKNSEPSLHAAMMVAAFSGDHGQSDEHGEVHWKHKTAVLVTCQHHCLAVHAC